MNNVIIANIILGIGLIINAIAMQQRKKKQILIGLIVANLICAVSYIILNSYSAVITCFISIMQTCVKYTFDKKEKKVPLILQVIFILTSIVGGILTSKNILDIIPTICLVLYTTSILQSKEKNIRLFTSANILCWVIYDVYIRAYIGILLNSFSLISVIVAIIRYDILKKNKIINDKL